MERGSKVGWEFMCWLWFDRLFMRNTLWDLMVMHLISINCIEILFENVLLFAFIKTCEIYFFDDDYAYYYLLISKMYSLTWRILYIDYQIYILFWVVGFDRLPNSLSLYNSLLYFFNFSELENILIDCSHPSSSKPTPWLGRLSMQSWYMYIFW